MEVADANELDLLGFDLQLGQLIDNAGLWCRRTSAHGVAGIPEHVVLAMLDEVAAEGEGQFLSWVGESVGESYTDVVHHLCAAVKSGEGDLGCGLGLRSLESECASTSYECMDGVLAKHGILRKDGSALSPHEGGK